MNGGHYISVVKATDGHYYEINDSRQRKINNIDAYWNEHEGNILLADFGDSREIEVPETVIHMESSEDEAGSMGSGETRGFTEIGNSSRESSPSELLSVSKQPWGSISKGWGAAYHNAHPTAVKEHFFLKGMPNIDESIIEKIRPYLEPLLKSGVISNEQADAVIALIACNEKGSMSLLGDEPGLGRHER